MSMICLNPFTCVSQCCYLVPQVVFKRFGSNCFISWLQSFMDLQFPNGQLTYVAGEGLNTSAFLPLFGGLFQVQGQYPGETKFSFSCKVCALSSTKFW